MIAADIRELLPLYALGMLEPSEAAVVDRAIAGDPALAGELAAYQDAADQIITPVVPSPDVKARLLASIGGGRFEAFSDRLAAMFDVGIDRVRELLGLIERPDSWEPQLPGIDLVHFAGGAAYANADCGFVRLAVGTTFPPHTHMGDELTIILSGQVKDPVNNVMRGPGHQLVQAKGTQHVFACEGDQVCIYAARAVDGIEVAGALVRPMKR